MKTLIVVIISMLICYTGCGPTGGSDSPANSVKDFVLALKEQNPGKAWNFLSSGSQKMYDDLAKNRNLSGKEYFEKSVSDPKYLGMIGMEFDVTDEIKEGDSAKVVIKTKDDKTSDLYSIRENGVWKLDYVRTFRENMKKVDQ